MIYDFEKQLQEADKTQLEFKLFCREVRKIKKSHQKWQPFPDPIGW